jgi:hypothetical protein
VDSAFHRRYIHEGFSGGEKKRAEILQIAMLRPDDGGRGRRGVDATRSGSSFSTASGCAEACLLLVITRTGIFDDAPDVVLM